jgi:hypothetical protein
MAFQRHYIIPFKSFRQGTDYRLCIWEDGYTGAEVTLEPAADPFTTEEDGDEDVFTPVRTQTGTIRIVDSGAVSWRSIMPLNDLQKPVTLEVMNEPVWVGYLQSENYDGVLYGNPQERELPVQCPLSVLEAIQVRTTETEMRNFAYVLKYIIDSLPSYTNTVNDPVINRVIVQGGSDARQWLMNKVDWMNYVRSDDVDGDTPRYDLLEILTDICRFWGWTARVMQRTLYLTCMDDTAEQTMLTLTYQQLATLAGGTSSGDVSNLPAVRTLTGDIFVDTDNEDMQLRGPSKATVKADCNKQDTVVSTKNKLICDVLEFNTTWQWVSGDEDRVGYFETTPAKGAFSTTVMDGTAASGRGAFTRRKIYSSKDSDSSTDATMILLGADSGSETNPMFQLKTSRARMYGGGSLGFKGSIYKGAKLLEANPDGHYGILARIGIGMTRATAKWFYFQNDMGQLSNGWADEPFNNIINIEGSNINGINARFDFAVIVVDYTSKYIPVDDNLYGYIYLDIMGWVDGDGLRTDAMGIANMEIEFTRDKTYLPSHQGETRPRMMERERDSEREYTSTSNGQTHDEWNADCIYASDNDMEYGYGLLMQPDGEYMQKVPYGNTTEWAEQHLANRVTTYWQQTRRMMTANVAYQYAATLIPVNKVSLAGTTCQSVSISHDWWNDEIELKLIEL